MSSQLTEPPAKQRSCSRSCTDKLPADGDTLAAAVLELPYTEKLVHHHAGQLSRSRGFNQTDDEDIAQELRLVIYQACLKYDRSQGAIESFIATVVRNRVRELARQRMALCRTPESEAGSLNQRIDTEDGPKEWAEMFDVEEHGRRRGGQRCSETQQVELRHDIDAVLSSLSDETREVARLLRHHSPPEIQEILGTTRAKVRTHIALIREHFQEHDLDGRIND